ncbi:hypothetical protein JCGZ_04992 [Jatropha curcas]|uniref:Glycosyltransferase n=2 Tax=Jatropha curcas TaxID=180498 RepID=A0A067L2V9_JATCU|nr:hypothetical protein JCGZ_04992 [Jatropha curcas]
MENAHLVFVPHPVIGHLISTVEVARLLLNRDQRFSISFLIMKLSSSDFKINNYIQSFTASNALPSRIQFIDLPKDEAQISDFTSFIQRQKPHVKDVVSKIIQSKSDSPRLAGFVLDMCCAEMIDVANEFGVPSYIYFTSSAAFLGFSLHVQSIHDEQKVDPAELMNPGAELAISCLANPFPAKAMPYALLRKEWLDSWLDYVRRFKEAKGIMVNTFLELESYAVESFSSDGKTPKVYPVGPILNVGSDEDSNKQQEIMQWLDTQPPTSVVFLCFGSMGSFNVDQVKEIACAVEHSGHRFLWSLRRPSSNVDLFEPPSDYANLQEVLPEGFLDRTVGIGRVIGWAQQEAILAHPAVGGFVSHCGWNSVLESIWYGVPIATWPMYSEQQVIAFEMVIELQLAVEIKMDYRMGSEVIVSSDEIERGIRCVMEHDSERRKKVKKMSEKCRMALKDGGSSFISLGFMIKDVMDNMV